MTCGVKIRVDQLNDADIYDAAELGDSAGVDAGATLVGIDSTAYTQISSSLTDLHAVADDIDALFAARTEPFAAQGDLLYRGASAPAILSIGSIGDVLTVNGGGTDPEWAAPSGGNQWAYVEVTKTASYTVVSGDDRSLIKMDTSTPDTALVATLPAIAGLSNGWRVTIQHNEATGAAPTGPHLVTVVGPAGEAFDGVVITTLTLEPGDAVTIVRTNATTFDTIATSRTNPATPHLGKMIAAYDAVGGAALPAVVAIATVTVNTHAANYALGTVSANAITILQDGVYEILAQGTAIDGGGGGNAALFRLHIAAPSGAGFGAVAGTDCHAHMTAIGGQQTASTMHTVVVSGGGGIDVRLNGLIFAGGPSSATDSRLSVKRVG